MQKIKKDAKYIYFNIKLINLRIKPHLIWHMIENIYLYYIQYIKWVTYDDLNKK